MAKHVLFTPGPTNLPPEVLEALARPIVHHRSPEFAPIFKQARENLRYLFRTENPVVPLICSGTGGMEAAATSLLARGDQAVYVSAGKFSQRWGAICRAYGIDAHGYEIDWSLGATPDLVQRMLREHPAAKVVFTTHCETTSGSLSDIEGIARVVSGTNAVLVVDAISSLGAEPLETDAWGVDVVVTGSQKALMLPPGMAFVSVSPKARARIESCDSTVFYFSLKKALASLDEGTTPWTSQITMTVALNAAVDLVRRTGGVEAAWLRHARRARAIRAGCETLGMCEYSRAPSNVVMAMVPPDGIDAGRLIRCLRDEFGFTVAGGQERLKGRIVRIAALGHIDDEAILSLMTALEEAFRHQGREVEPGVAAAAAKRALSPPPTPA
ncbi:alanine--glyoxylate aminotransferase family protein [Candidatus Sumerlaeota bacterium]|nr:alanine--glyoxylate aminotransferase family protein [Candidatus Sumerlaeota bacterium]